MIPKLTQYFRLAFNYCFSRSSYKTYKAVAKDAGVSVSTMSEILNKKSYSHKTQEKIAKIFGYDDLLDFLDLGKRLAAGSDEMISGDKIFVIHVNSDSEKEIIHENEMHYKGIPLFESGKLAAGENGLIFDPYEEPASTILMGRQEMTGRNHHRLVGFRVGGVSMHPVIQKGAVVIVDLDDRKFTADKLYAVNFPEDGDQIAAVKRVRKWSHGFVLISDHPDYPPKVTDLDWLDLCVGKVVWIWTQVAI